MRQKIVITDSETIINDWIEQGWEVVSIIPQHVATAQGYSRGNFCFLLEIDTNE